MKRSVSNAAIGTDAMAKKCKQKQKKNKGYQSIDECEADEEDDEPCIKCSEWYGCYGDRHCTSCGSEKP